MGQFYHENIGCKLSFEIFGYYNRVVALFRVFLIISGTIANFNKFTIRANLYKLTQ